MTEYETYQYWKDQWKELFQNLKIANKFDKDQQISKYLSNVYYDKITRSFKDQQSRLRTLTLACKKIAFSARKVPLFFKEVFQNIEQINILIDYNDDRQKQIEFMLKYDEQISQQQLDMVNQLRSQGVDYSKAENEQQMNIQKKIQKIMYEHQQLFILMASKIQTLKEGNDEIQNKIQETKQKFQIEYNNSSLSKKSNMSQTSQNINPISQQVQQTKEAIRQNQPSATVSQQHQKNMDYLQQNQPQLSNEDMIAANNQTLNTQVQQQIQIKNLQTQQIQPDSNRMISEQDLKKYFFRQIQAHQIKANQLEGLIKFVQQISDSNVLQIKYIQNKLVELDKYNQWNNQQRETQFNQVWNQLSQFNKIFSAKQIEYKEQLANLRKIISSQNQTQQNKISKNSRQIQALQQTNDNQFSQIWEEIQHLKNNLNNKSSYKSEIQQYKPQPPKPSKIIASQANYKTVSEDFDEDDQYNIIQKYGGRYFTQSQQQQGEKPQKKMKTESINESKSNQYQSFFAPWR